LFRLLNLGLGWSAAASVSFASSCRHGCGQVCREPQIARLTSRVVARSLECVEVVSGVGVAAMDHRRHAGARSAAEAIATLVTIQ
jgi:hypothetical protein